MTIGPEAIDEAASILWQTWRESSRIEALPVRCRPFSREDGYSIAASIAVQSGMQVVGWKIAATSEAGQRHINVDGPLAGRILSDRLLESGATVQLGNNIMQVAEAEFAFRFSRELPAMAGEYHLDDVMTAVSSLHLSMEVPDSRYEDFTKVGAAQLIADTACACWLVVGPPVECDWRQVDLAGHDVKAFVDGRLAATGSGSAALGDPRIALTWLVNEVARHCGGIRAGDLVTTGTCIVPVAIRPGALVRLDYGAFGEISASIT